MTDAQSTPAPPADVGELVKRLRSVSLVIDEYGSARSPNWCLDAATAIERIARERDEARAQLSATTPAPSPPAPGEHWSDCAVHNGPALPVGPCDCGADDLQKVERLREVLTDIAAAQMLWNGGIAPRPREDLQAFITELQNDVRAALTPENARPATAPSKEGT